MPAHRWARWREIRGKSAVSLDPAHVSRRRAWLIVFAIGWTFTIACGLAWYALSLYLNALVSSRGFTLTSVSDAISCFFLVSAVANLPLSRLIRRVEPRLVMFAGSLVCGASLLLLGHVASVWQLYLVFILLGCGFSASSYLPGTAVIVALFDRDRVRALAIAMTGGSASGVVLAPLMARILATWGLPTVAPWLGLAYLVLAGVPTMAIVRGRLTAPRRSDPDHNEGIPYARAVRSGSFALAAVCFAVLMADQTAIQVQVVSIGSAMGIRDPGIAVTIMAGATIVGRLVGAYALRRVPVLRFAVAVAALQGLSFAALALLPGLAGLGGGIALFGLTAGNLSVLIPLAVVDMFGLTDYPRIYALIQFASSLGSAAGPAVLAGLYGGFGGYRLPLLILAGLAGLIATASTRLRRPARLGVPASLPARSAALPAVRHPRHNGNGRYEPGHQAGAEPGSLTSSNAGRAI